MSIFLWQRLQGFTLDISN